MSEPTPAAIFISYAREDTIAADRIAEALRSHGIEVWFDQNELRGGEAWDQKIRCQIRTCTLLIPIVSANTQSRGEGYFRREWKLAAERTHDMAAGIPFLVPVVIDDTAEAAALVPEEFLRVQWTRLPQGRTTPQFAAQVKRLLEAPRGATASRAEPKRAHAAAPDDSATFSAERPAPHRRFPVAAWALGLAGFALAGYLLLNRTTPPAAPNPGTAEKSAPKGPQPAERPAAPAADAKSIAVLPFENLSTEPDSAFFADGIHDEVLTAVGKVSALSKVIGRTSVLPYADVKKRDLREIGAKLGVGSVLEGTVRRLGTRVKVAVYLIEVQTSRQLWSESYERELTDVFAIQSAIAQEIATTLKATLTVGERETLGQQLTKNAEAYRLYLQGRATLREVGTPRLANRTTVEAAIALYEQAAAADPSFPLPHLELTRCYGWTYWFGFFNPTADNARRAEASAARVRQLMPGKPEVRLANGLVAYLCRQNWDEALTELRAAQVGLPNASDAIRFEAFALRRLGRLSEAVQVLERAMVIDPQDKLGADSIVETQLMARRYADAVRAADTLAARELVTETTGAIRAYAQLALDGDLAAYRAKMRPMLPGLVRGFLPDLAWRPDMMARDFVAVDAFFARSDGFLSGPGGVVNNPVAQFRALLAYLQGKPQEARQLAAEARQHFESHQWMPRQLSTVAAEVALAHALEGNAAKAREAIQKSRDHHRQLPDALVETGLHYLWAVTHVVLGDREAALAELRICVNQMSIMQLIPTLAHLDPTWDSIKDDTRFAEIMKSARPM